MGGGRKRREKRRIWDANEFPVISLFFFQHRLLYKMDGAALPARA